jgi:hypothetical protein
LNERLHFQPVKDSQRNTCIFLCNVLASIKYLGTFVYIQITDNKMLTQITESIRRQKPNQT